MKRLALLTLLSTPAFANQIPFNDPDYIKISGGDPKAAQELAVYCIGKDKNTCINDLRGSGNLQMEAARNCVQQSQSTVINFKFPNGIEIPGSRAHQVYGNIWHEDYRTDSDGEHRHVFTTQDRNAARSEAEDRQRQKELAVVLSNKGTSSDSTGKEIGGDLQFGTGSISPINVQVTLTTKGNDSKTITAGLLNDLAKQRIKESGDAAFKNPSVYSTQRPSVVCPRNEIFCITGDGSKVKNESYQTDKKDDRKEEKKDDKKRR